MSQTFIYPVFFQQPVTVSNGLTGTFYGDGSNLSGAALPGQQNINTTVQQISGTSTTVQSNSATAWNYQGTDLKALTGKYEDTSTTVQSNSATAWNYQGTDLKALTGKYEDTSTTVQTNSANWNTAYTIATSYQSVSSTFATGGLQTTLNYLSTNNLKLSSADVLGNLIVYGTLSALSAEFINITNSFVSNVTSVSSLFVDGDLTVSGNISGNNLRTSFNLGSATGNYSFAGNRGRAFGTNSAAFSQGTAYGTNSFARGTNTEAYGADSVAEGSLSEAWSLGSYAGNQFSRATGDYSRSEGGGSIATGRTSQATGFYTFAGGKASQANGYYTGAATGGSLTEGIYTIVGDLVPYSYDLGTKIFTFTPQNSAKLNFITVTPSIPYFIQIVKSDGKLNNITITERNTITGQMTAGEIGFGITDTGFFIATFNNFNENSGLVFQEHAGHAEGIGTVTKGIASHAAGYNAVAAHNYTYAWSDGTLGTLPLSSKSITTTRSGQYMVSASGGMFIPGKVGIGTDSLDNALTVVGNISASGDIYSPNLVKSNSTLETPTTGISAIQNIVSLSQATYDALDIKLPTTLYVIV
jgi:hypothetical protein